ncbi:hypothetical protein BDF20DRAFT_883850 [Mycotypha africana]|uniref:uncharacterized protein n=1 Tax=Mycotypha africana TaxID=64632 RepID=UPI002300124A|nr:uncharacterized protein BDF20DRAFT_883850 [Mycotypha africana]KAI8973731.1 hypothetical protein BDF20DRAFT_883850 [Mycotypha africana]
MKTTIHCLSSNILSLITILLLYIVYAFSIENSDNLSPTTARQFDCVYKTLRRDYGIESSLDEEGDSAGDDNIWARNLTIITYWRKQNFTTFKLDRQTEIIERWAFTSFAHTHGNTTTGQAMEFCSRDPVEGFGIIFVQLVARAFNCVFQQVFKSCGSSANTITA